MADMGTYQRYRDAPDYCGCEWIIWFAGACLLMMFGTIVLLVTTTVTHENARGNVILTSDALVYRVTQTVTQYNSGLLHSKPDPAMSNATLTGVFCFFFVVAAIVCYAWAKRPRLLDAIATGLCVATLVIFLSIAGASTRCEVGDIVREPYKTGEACGIRGSQSISLNALFEQRVQITQGVTEFASRREIERIIERLVTLTIQARVLNTSGEPPEPDPDDSAGDDYVVVLSGGL